MKPITIRLWVPDTAPDLELDSNQRVQRDMVREYLAALPPDEYATAELLTDRQIQEIADGIARREYHATVQGFVDDLLAQIRAGDITDRDAADEYLVDSIDGCHDVIYTYAAQEVLRQSDHDGAYFDDYGSEGAIENGAIQWSKLAYCALLADVRDALPDLDEIFQCEACGEDDLTVADWTAAGPEAMRATCEACRYLDPPRYSRTSRYD